METIQIKLLVWRVNVVIRQTEAQKEGVSPQNLAELVHDWDGPPFPKQDGLTSE